MSSLINIRVLKTINRYNRHKKLGYLTDILNNVSNSKQLVYNRDNKKLE